MPISTVIRTKRKEAALTQEQVASYLGVSTPAVNKWEKGSSYPDVTILPALARLLGVDLNTLLCFEEGLSEQEILKFSEQVMKVIPVDYSKGFALAMDKIREYPSCFSLIHSMAILLDGALMLYAPMVPERERYETQIKELYERAAGSEDSDVRNKSIYMLVSKSMKEENYEEAKKLLDRLPERNILDKKQLEASLLLQQNKTQEAQVILERKLLQVLNELQMVLVKLTEAAAKEQNYDYAELLSDLYQKVIRQFDLWEYSAYIAPLEVAVAKHEASLCVKLLDQMLKEAMTPWDIRRAKWFKHTLTVKEEEGEKDRREQFGKTIVSSLLEEPRTNPKFSFLQEDEDFKHLIKKYS